MKRWLLIALLLTAPFMLLLIAQNATPKEADIIAKGKMSTLTGNLTFTGSDWFIAVKDSKTLVLTGPIGYLVKERGMKPVARDNITVKGFLLNNTLVATTFTVKGKDYVVRNDKGEPTWDVKKYAQIESKSYSIDPKKCTGCNLCTRECPVGAIKIVKGKAVIDPEKCIRCGICLNGSGKSYPSCPFKAVVSH